MHHSCPRALLACCALAASLGASAAPFATTYTGTIGASTLPGAASGQPYTITLVVDNGNAAPASQSWATGDVTCAIWRAGGVALAHDVAAVGRASGYGTLAADAAGQLLDMFDGLRTTGAGLPPGSYTATGLPAGATVEWLLLSNATLRLGTGEQFTDARPNDGSVLDPANWSAPAPFGGPCSAAAQPAAAAMPVPALGLPALALLGAGFAGLGARRLRKKERPHAPPLRGSLPPEGALFALGRPSGKKGRAA